MIRTEEVCKTYVSGRTVTEVLKNVDLQVARGECLLLRGPSGSGKTTLLNIIGCISKPSSGSVVIDGEAISHLPEHFLARLRRMKTGFMFQQFNLLPGFNVLQNVAMPLVPLGLNERERNRKAALLLERLNMEHRLGYGVNELSGGEQQRVALARALINDPEIILADEPSSNVDEDNGREILSLLQELKRQGKTIVLSSHDILVEESGLADKAFTLDSIR